MYLLVTIDTGSGTPEVETTIYRSESRARVAQMFVHDVCNGDGCIRYAETLAGFDEFCRDNAMEEPYISYAIIPIPE